MKHTLELSIPVKTPPMLTAPKMLTLMLMMMIRSTTILITKMNNLMKITQVITLTLH